MNPSETTSPAKSCSYSAKDLYEQIMRAPALADRQNLGWKAFQRKPSPMVSQPEQQQQQVKQIATSKPPN